MTGLMTRRMGLALVLMGALGTVSAVAQGPEEGMGPHRPPMERAMGPGGMGEHGRWWNDQHAIDKFKLTETQRKTMDDTYQQHRVNLIDLHAALEKQEVGMEPLMHADQPDEGKILAQIDRIAQSRADLEKANARMLLEIRKQLTPEQWKLIQADRAARRNGHGGPEGEGRWHGRGPGGGQGGPAGGAGSDQAPPPSGGPGEE